MKDNMANGTPGIGQPKVRYMNELRLPSSDMNELRPSHADGDVNGLRKNISPNEIRHPGAYDDIPGSGGFETGMVCELHQRDVNNICENCNRIVCDACGESHKEHKIVGLTLSNLHAVCFHLGNEIVGQISSANVVKSDFDHKRRSIIEHVKETKYTISQRKDMMITMIENCFKASIDKLDGIETKLDEFDELAVCEQKELSSLLQCSENTLKQTFSGDMLQNAMDIQTKLTEIKHLQTSDYESIQQLRLVNQGPLGASELLAAAFELQCEDETFVKPTNGAVKKVKKRDSKRLSSSSDTGDEYNIKSMTKERDLVLPGDHKFTMADKVDAGKLILCQPNDNAISEIDVGTEDIDIQKLTEEYESVAQCTVVHKSDDTTRYAMISTNALIITDNFTKTKKTVPNRRKVFKAIASCSKEEFATLEVEMTNNNVAKEIRITMWDSRSMNSKRHVNIHAYPLQMHIGTSCTLYQYTENDFIFISNNEKIAYKISLNPNGILPFTDAFDDCLTYVTVDCDGNILFGDNSGKIHVLTSRNKRKMLNLSEVRDLGTVTIRGLCRHVNYLYVLVGSHARRRIIEYKLF